MSGPRLRFAPSPTGYLHVGGARTALFNWLYARRHGGAFILRIEDTDVARSSDAMVEGILEGLRWLGLVWDEGPEVGGPYGPYFQSARLDRYRAAAQRLLETDHAYFCYCSAEHLRAQRLAARARGEGWMYDRACRYLPPEERARRDASGQARVVRFKVPDGRTRFEDKVHGPIEVDHATLDDFVLLRADGLPTYQLSVVVDDIEMAVTHVIRGDDHISNTPKQILLYHAFGAPVPVFAHVPLILGPDRKRLSKRHGATSVTEYRRRGYLPEAVVNFLALLGWSPGTDEEIFTREELIARFSLEGIRASQAVFDPTKLDWFNAQHLARLSADELADRLEEPLRVAGLWRDEWRGADRVWFLRVIDLLRPRARRLSDLVEEGRPFFGEVTEYEPEAVDRYLRVPGLLDHLAALREALAEVEPFERGRVEEVLRRVAAQRGLKAAVLIHATRVAVTGRAVSPGLFEVLELLGRERVLARLARLERTLVNGLPNG